MRGQHLVAAGLLLIVFFLVYSWATPFDEMMLIRQGNVAAALTLGGAMVGFSMTVASGLIHTDTLRSFLAWSAAAAGTSDGGRRFARFVAQGGSVRRARSSPAR